MPYKLNQLCIPFGVGFKFAVTKKVDAARVGLRRTYTDYIDDAQRHLRQQHHAAGRIRPAHRAPGRPSACCGRPSSTPAARAAIRRPGDWYQYTGLTISFLLTRVHGM